MCSFWSSVQNKCKRITEFDWFYSSKTSNEVWVYKMIFQRETILKPQHVSRADWRYLKTINIVCNIDQYLRCSIIWHFLISVQNNIVVRFSVVLMIIVTWTMKKVVFSSKSNNILIYLYSKSSYISRISYIFYFLEYQTIKVNF